jgi:hypothetical protein
MSENKETAEVEIIPLDAVIDVKIGGSFVARLSSFLTDFFPYKSKEHFTQLIESIKENKNLDDPFVFHFQTLIFLQKHLEEEARAQNKTKKVTVDLKTGEPIEEGNQSDPQTPVQSESPDSAHP